MPESETTERLLMFPRPYGLCKAGSDGECDHPDCPQLRDGEPEKSGRSCPLWTEHDREEE